MQQLSDQDKEAIKSELERRNAVLPCPRCGNKSFQLADGYINLPLSGEVGGIVLGGPTMPTAVVVCSNCGYISLHALGALGLIQNRGR